MSTRTKRKTHNTDEVTSLSVASSTRSSSSSVPLVPPSPSVPPRRSTRASPSLRPIATELNQIPNIDATATSKPSKSKVKNETISIKEEADDDLDANGDEIEEVAPPPTKKGGKKSNTPTPTATAAAASSKKKATKKEPVEEEIEPVPAKNQSRKRAASSDVVNSTTSKKNKKATEEEEIIVKEEEPSDDEQAGEEDEDEDQEDEDEAEEDGDEVDEEEDENTRWAKSLPEYDGIGFEEGDSEIEDMEDDSDDEDDEDEDDDDGIKSEPDDSAHSADGEKFGSALTSLLSKPLPKSVLEGKQAPVLLHDRTLTQRHAIPNAARLAKRQAAERKLAKKYMYNKDHVEKPQVDLVEKKLMRIATKGVVTLFNAVAKQQKELKRVQEEVEDDKKKVDISQSGFLQLLKSEGENVGSTSLPTPATMKVKKEATATSGSSAGATGASGWKVLNEDYLMGGKMTDWDKAIHSSEEEEEDDE